MVGIISQLTYLPILHITLLFSLFSSPFMHITSLNLLPFSSMFLCSSVIEPINIKLFWALKSLALRFVFCPFILLSHPMQYPCTVQDMSVIQGQEQRGHPLWRFYFSRSGIRFSRSPLGRLLFVSSLLLFSGFIFVLFFCWIILGNFFVPSQPWEIFASHKERWESRLWMDLLSHREAHEMITLDQFTHMQERRWQLLQSH